VVARSCRRVLRDHVGSGRAGYVSGGGGGSQVGRRPAGATVSTSTGTVLRVLSVLFASGAVVCLGFAIAGMVNHRQGPLTGYLLRVGALACFGAAVVLNVVAH
jgi:hypothetical protein